MSQSIQCQAQITSQRSCTNRTSSPDGLCYRHKKIFSFFSNKRNGGKAIPRVDDVATKHGDQGTSNSGLASFAPSFTNMRWENKNLRDAIRMAYPDTRLNLFDDMNLKEIHDTDRLRDILTLTTALFPGRIDRHGSAMTTIDKVFRMHRGALRDLISASEYIEDSYLGFHDAVELRREVSQRFHSNLNNQDPIPNFAAHMKVDAFVRTLPDHFYSYLQRDGLARTVHEHPEGTDEIIEYVRTHEYYPFGEPYGVDSDIYSETELQAIFIHNALDEGVL